MSAQRTQVVFVTPVFGAVRNGPAIYANYLWAEFQADSEIEFHVVAPDRPSQHPQLHEFGHPYHSKEFYEAMQRTALCVAEELHRRTGSRPIIHGNNSHSMSMFDDYEGKVIIQINDYDTARAFYEPLTNIRRYGARRFLSLTWRHLRERAALSAADKIICNSRFVGDELLRRYRLPIDRKIKVIYKAVESSFFERDSHSLTNSQLETRMLFLGTNWLGKGLDIAIKALGLLPEQHADAQLVVAGESSTEHQRVISRLVRELGLEKRVNFLGHVARKDLPSVLHQSDLLIFPSRNEAFGVAVLEALAAGVPVVASNVGGIPEILGNASYSRLVDPCSPLDFANAVDQFLTNDTPKHKLQEEGRAIAEQFSVARMTAALRELYRRSDNQ